VRAALIALALAALAQAGCAHTEATLAPEFVVPPPTLAAPGGSVTRFVVGSCAKQSRPHPFWASIIKTQADGFLFLGDNVYGDTTVDAPSSPEMPELRAAYRMLGEKKSFQKMRAAMPIYPIWDDHDYGQNDQGVGFPHKAMSEAIFLDFWRVPADDVRRTRPGIHRAWTLRQTTEEHGDRTVQIIALDTRHFRDDLRTGFFGLHYLRHTDEDTTMLGAAQWAWLEQTLAQPADVRILMTGVQVLSQSHPWERWDNFPHERDRLLELLGASGPVVIVSGDRHIGGIYRDGGIHELTASGLTQSLNSRSIGQSEPEEDPLRMGPATVATNWGLIDLDWAADTMRLSLHDAEDGRTHQMVEVPLSGGRAIVAD
jgi:alkaline phosphatase D